MKVVSTEIPDVKIVEPEVFGDSRGYFVEQYNRARFAEFGIDADFVQDNESCSSKGVFRGFHWQRAPFGQAKLVRVVRGAVIDIAVDVRASSPTYGKYVSVMLSGENKCQLYIPRGFAHGFAVLEDDTIFSYKCDNFYVPEAECGINPSDEFLSGALPFAPSEFSMSAKDKVLPLFKDITPYIEE
jgi:dTDP-4-dehydrorhamnose 3,5-epimerase